MENKMAKQHKIKRIVVVGGGSAGWMTAAALARVLGRNYCQITLVESEQIGSVSVGEATIPQIKLFNQILGIDEDEFIKRTKGSFKLGIEFIDWKKAAEGNSHSSYFHPFGDYGTTMNAIQFHHYWLKLYQQGQFQDLDAFSLAAIAARRNKFMRPKNMGNSPLSQINYAFHFDTTLYAKYLQEFAVERGVIRLEGKVIDVSTAPNNGFIKSISLANGDVIEGDLFIDCSGFKALLIEGALESKYTDWSEVLPCNSAVAMPCENSDAENLAPYTQAKAQKAGWTWRIPLQHRVGNGYVYPSQFISDDEAVSILTNQMENQPLCEPNFLRWKSGIREKSWVKNCVAIGLSAGFIEPLESTGLHLIQSAIAKLMSFFPHQGFDQTDIDSFNQQTKTEIEYIRDFVVLHYKVTDRDDSEFWRYCQNMPVSEHLQAKIDLYQTNGRIFRHNNELFTETSWLSVMHGQGLVANGYHPLVDALVEDEVARRLKHIHSVIQNSVETMPQHNDFIRQYCAAGPIDSASLI